MVSSGFRLALRCRVLPTTASPRRAVADENRPATNKSQVLDSAASRARTAPSSCSSLGEDNNFWRCGKLDIFGSGEKNKNEKQSKLQSKQPFDSIIASWKFMRTARCRRFVVVVE